MKNNFGIGFDAHKLVNNGNLTIGGVVIDEKYSLEGDSDGDVLIHAIIDSLLGAAGLGDIGHFFNKDNVINSSIEMLKQINLVLKQQKWDINNIDSTVISENFHIKNHSQEMKNTISLSLGINSNQINIKGKSTDGLGFTGDNLGISAFAISSLIKRN